MFVVLSNMNCTDAMPTVDEAVADSVLVPERVAFAIGIVMDPLGGGTTVAGWKA
jgi:hypothetical protein